MGVVVSPGRWTGGARRRPPSTVRAGGRGTELRMGVPWCLWGAEQGRVRHTACRGVGGPLTAVGASCGAGWGRQGWVGAGGREEGISRGKRSGPGGSGMQSEQCYRQWRKVRKGGGAGGPGVGGGRRWAWRSSRGGTGRGWPLGVASGGWEGGGRTVGGLCRGRVTGVVWGGQGGGRKSRGKRSRPVGSGMQSEQCYRRWRKVRGGGGLVGPAWAGAVAGCGVRRAVVTAGGEGWGVRLVRGGVSGAACRGCRVWELDCLRSRAGLWGGGGVWRWWVSPATGVLLRGSDEDVDCMGTEAGEPGAGAWGAGGGLSLAGMAGVPWGPVGAEAPHVGRVRNHNLCFRHRSS